MLWLSYCFLLNLGEGVESHISFIHTGVAHKDAGILKDLSTKTWVQTVRKKPSPAETLWFFYSFSPLWFLRSFHFRLIKSICVFSLIATLPVTILMTDVPDVSSVIIWLISTFKTPRHAVKWRPPQSFNNTVKPLKTLSIKSQHATPQYH